MNDSDVYAARHLLEKLEAWRETRQHRERIPESLWEEAAELAVRHGTYKTARALRLHYGDLKRRVAALTQALSRRQPAPAPVDAVTPTFIEVLATSLPSHVTACRLEVHSPRGAVMRIEMAQVGPSTLSTLIRDFTS